MYEVIISAWHRCMLTVSCELGSEPFHNQAPNNMCGKKVCLIDCLIYKSVTQPTNPHLGDIIVENRV